MYPDKSIQDCVLDGISEIRRNLETHFSPNQFSRDTALNKVL
jgi:hypothetical protein